MPLNSCKIKTKVNHSLHAGEIFMLLLKFADFFQINFVKIILSGTLIRVSKDLDPDQDWYECIHVIFKIIFYFMNQNICCGIDRLEIIHNFMVKIVYLYL